MWVTPEASIILVTATPAAPRPTTSTRSSSIGLPVIFSALNSAAIVTTAVPCWSSWKTGMSSDSFSRSSISKQRGAEMSSRLMPPKVGAISSTALMISSASWVSRQIGKASTCGELLEQHRLALHHRHRRLGADVAEAEHGAAVGDDGDGVLLDRVLEGLGAVGVDVLADPGDARRVGHREVVARLQRVLVLDRDLAAAVHLHRAVDVVEDLGAAGRADRPQDPLPVLAVLGVDRELAHPLALAAGARHEVDALQLPARLGDRRGQFAQRLLPRVELDPDRDAVLGADGHGRLSNQIRTVGPWHGVAGRRSNIRRATLAAVETGLASVLFV